MAPEIRKPSSRFRAFRISGSRGPDASSGPNNFPLAAETSSDGNAAGHRRRPFATLAEGLQVPIFHRSSFRPLRGSRRESDPSKDKVQQLRLKDGRSVEAEAVIEGRIWRVDLRQLLADKNPDWQAEVTRVAQEAPDVSFRGGDVGTSAEAADFVTQYQPTTGDVIAERLPWYLELVQNEFTEVGKMLSGDPSLHLGDDLEHSLNFNYTRGRRPGEKTGRRYEKHKDRNPWTMLTAILTVKEGLGGKTNFFKTVKSRITGKERYKTIASLRPEAGYGVFFNGHTVHSVEEYLGMEDVHGPRLVNPADMYTDAIPQTVDKGFNNTILKPQDGK